MNNNHGPLRGVRIVELATVLMAPLATQILGDMGADVVKVEGEQIDTGRLLGAGPHQELSGVALNLLRNKRSIQLDLKRPDGLTVMHRLLEVADVFVTNLRPSALARLKLSYDDVKELAPQLIYCEAHGFRTGTSESDRPAFDDVIQAETGLPHLPSMVGDRTAFLPSVIADKVSGLYVGQAILAALYSRGNSKAGQRIEVPMFDAMLSFGLTEHLSGATIPGQPAGYSRIMTPHRGPHKTSDGYLALLPYSDQDWATIFREADAEADLSDPAYADVRSRHADSTKVYGRLAELIRTKSTDEWIRIATEHGIPFGRVRSLQEMADDAEAHRGMLVEAEHPHVGTYRQISSPFVFSDTPTTIRAHAPLVGEQTIEILRAAGYTEPEITTLIETGSATQCAEANPSTAAPIS